MMHLTKQGSKVRNIFLRTCNYWERLAVQLRLCIFYIFPIFRQARPYSFREWTKWIIQETRHNSKHQGAIEYKILKGNGLNLWAEPPRIKLYRVDPSPPLGFQNRIGIKKGEQQAGHRLHMARFLEFILKDWSETRYSCVGPWTLVKQAKFMWSQTPPLLVFKCWSCFIVMDPW